MSVDFDPVFPFAGRDLPVRQDHLPGPVLLVVHPLALIAPTVRELQDASAVLLVVLEASLVHFAVRPSVLAVPFAIK